jgi:hypothetical protein
VSKHGNRRKHRDIVNLGQKKTSVPPKKLGQGDWADVGGKTRIWRLDLHSDWVSKCLLIWKSELRRGWGPKNHRHQKLQYIDVHQLGWYIQKPSLNFQSFPQFLHTISLIFMSTLSSPSKRKREEEEASCSCCDVPSTSPRSKQNSQCERAQICVYLNKHDIQHISKNYPGDKEDLESVAEWFAGWHVADQQREAQRSLETHNEQSVFFQHVVGHKVTVSAMTEFPYTPDNTIEREYWIWDHFRPDEWVIMHVHFAGKWCKDHQERCKRLDVVTNVNLRHSVTADGNSTEIWHRKCDDLDARREKRGSSVKAEGDPYPWRLQETSAASSPARFAIKLIMDKGNCAQESGSCRPTRLSISNH